MRAFVAIDPGAPLRAWLEPILERLRRSAPRVRWVRAANVHVTLCFLGEIGSERADSILGAVGAALVSDAVRPPSRLELSGPGVFGRAVAPRVFWLGFRDGDALEWLLAFHRRLEETLEPLGFAPERRAWRPHLTLGRNPRGVRVDEWMDVFGDRMFDATPGGRSARGEGGGGDGGAPAMELRAATLFSSELTPRGPVYRSVGAVRLDTSEIERHASNDELT